jgi:hypothetical protein
MTPSSTQQGQPVKSNPGSGLTRSNPVGDGLALLVAGGIIILVSVMPGCIRQKKPMLDSLPTIEIPRECQTGNVILKGCSHLGDVDMAGHPLPPKCKTSTITYKSGCEIIHVPADKQPPGTKWTPVTGQGVVIE